MRGKTRPESILNSYGWRGYDVLERVPTTRTAAAGENFFEFKKRGVTHTGRKRATKKSRKSTQEQIHS